MIDKGFKSRTGLNFFQVLFSTTRFSRVLSCEDLLISFLVDLVVTYVLMLRTILRLYVVLENTIETTMQSIGDIFGFTVVHKNKQAYILEKLILIRHTLKEKELNKTVSAKKGEIAQRFLLSSP